MRLAVLSDIHDRSQNLARVLDRLGAAQPQALLCCGDIGSAGIVDQLARFGVPLHLCLGNTDQAQAMSLMRTAHLMHASACAGHGELDLPGGGSVAYVHHPEPALELAQSGRFKAVFYGHTHRARVDHLDLPQGQRVLLANPGDVQARYDSPRALIWDSESGALSWVLAG